MSKPRTIIFFGPDGSGKTTQVNLLIRNLASQGYRVRRCWIRSLHSISYVVSSLLSFGLGLKDPRYFRTRYSKSRDFRRLWTMLEFVSVTPLVLVRMRIPLALGYTVIAERFVVDSIVSLAYFLNTTELFNGRMARVMLMMIPKHANLIYLDCDYECIIRRQHADIQSKAFFEFQRKWYSVCAKRLGATVYNTSTMSTDETLQKITLMTSIAIPQ